MPPKKKSTKKIDQQDKITKYLVKDVTDAVDIVKPTDYIPVTLHVEPDSSKITESFPQDEEDDDDFNFYGDSSDDDFDMYNDDLDPFMDEMVSGTFNSAFDHLMMVKDDNINHLSHNVTGVKYIKHESIKTERSSLSQSSYDNLSQRPSFMPSGLLPTIEEIGEEDEEPVDLLQDDMNDDSLGHMEEIDIVHSKVVPKRRKIQFQKPVIPQSICSSHVYLEKLDKSITPMMIQTLAKMDGVLKDYVYSRFDNLQDNSLSHKNLLKYYLFNILNSFTPYPPETDLEHLHTMDIDITSQTIGLESESEKEKTNKKKPQKKSTRKNNRRSSITHHRSSNISLETGNTCETVPVLSSALPSTPTLTAPSVETSVEVNDTRVYSLGLSSQTTELYNVLSKVTQGHSSQAVLLQGFQDEGKTNCLKHTLSDLYIDTLMNVQTKSQGFGTYDKLPFVTVHIPGLAVTNDLHTIQYITQQVCDQMSIPITINSNSSFVEYAQFLSHIIISSNRTGYDENDSGGSIFETSSKPLNPLSSSNPLNNNTNSHTTVDTASSLPFIFVLHDFHIFAKSSAKTNLSNISVSKQPLLYFLCDMMQTAAACVGIVGVTSVINSYEKLEKRIKSRLPMQVITFGHTTGNLGVKGVKLMLYKSLALPCKEGLLMNLQLKHKLLQQKEENEVKKNENGKNKNPEKSLDHMLSCDYEFINSSIYHYHTVTNALAPSLLSKSISSMLSYLPTASIVSEYNSSLWRAINDPHVEKNILTPAIMFGRSTKWYLSLSKYVLSCALRFPTFCHVTEGHGHTCGYRSTVQTIASTPSGRSILRQEYNSKREHDIDSESVTSLQSVKKRLFEDLSDSEEDVDILNNISQIPINNYPSQNSSKETVRHDNAGIVLRKTKKQKGGSMSDLLDSSNLLQNDQIVTLPLNLPTLPSVSHSIPEKSGKIEKSKKSKNNVDLSLLDEVSVPLRICTWDIWGGAALSSGNRNWMQVRHAIHKQHSKEATNHIIASSFNPTASFIDPAFQDQVYTDYSTGKNNYMTPFHTPLQTPQSSRSLSRSLSGLKSNSTRPSPHYQPLSRTNSSSLPYLNLNSLPGTTLSRTNSTLSQLSQSGHGKVASRPILAPSLSQSLWADSNRNNHNNINSLPTPTRRSGASTPLLTSHTNTNNNNKTNHNLEQPSTPISTLLPNLSLTLSRTYSGHNSQINMSAPGELLILPGLSQYNSNNPTNHSSLTQSTYNTPMLTARNAHVTVTSTPKNTPMPKLGSGISTPRQTTKYTFSQLHLESDEKQDQNNEITTPIPSTPKSVGFTPLVSSQSNTLNSISSKPLSKLVGLEPLLPVNTATNANNLMLADCTDLELTLIVAANILERQGVTPYTFDLLYHEYCTYINRSKVSITSGARGSGSSRLPPMVFTKNTCFQAFLALADANVFSYVQKLNNSDSNDDEYSTQTSGGGVGTSATVFISEAGEQMNGQIGNGDNGELFVPITNPGALVNVDYKSINVRTSIYEADCQNYIMDNSTKMPQWLVQWAQSVMSGTTR